MKKTSPIPFPAASRKPPALTALTATALAASGQVQFSYRFGVALNGETKDRRRQRHHRPQRASGSPAPSFMWMRLAERPTYLPFGPSASYWG